MKKILFSLLSLLFVFSLQAQYLKVHKPEGGGAVGIQMVIGNAEFGSTGSGGFMIRSQGLITDFVLASGGTQIVPLTIDGPHVNTLSDLNVGGMLGSSGGLELRGSNSGSYAMKIASSGRVGINGIDSDNRFVVKGGSGDNYIFRGRRNDNVAVFSVFNSGVSVHGSISKSSGTFKIDHPMDPANKYLYHSFVESPDMMNVYNGNVTTDAQGLAEVTLPDYFETLNREFRYQLTCMGTFAQAIIKEEVVGNKFVIQTSTPNVKVSWQVTGVRQDPWAEANRVQVEVDKAAEDRGLFIHPELYGQPASKSIGASQEVKEQDTSIKE